MRSGWWRGDVPSQLDPKGPAAESIADLWLLLVLLGLVAFVIVIVVLVVATVRRSAPAGDNDDGLAPEGATGSETSPWIARGGVVLPIVLIGAAFVASVSTMTALPQEAPPGSLVIEIVGHRWWWSATYRGTEVTVANELHIPVGEPVELWMTSADVIHSFWVPELHGKLDVFPDDRNVLVIEADERGEFRGECAEFCGLQHANMSVTIVADDRVDFDAWLVAQQRPAVLPSDPRATTGRQLFIDTGCGSCHTIRGTSRSTSPGPDLTHFASRSMFAGGIAENRRDSLIAWLHDPDTLKEGTAMPSGQLSDAEVKAVADYLSSLE